MSPPLAAVHAHGMYHGWEGAAMTALSSLGVAAALGPDQLDQEDDHEPGGHDPEGAQSDDYGAASAIGHDTS
jgi:hypothetical protein